MTLAFDTLPCPDSPVRRLDPRWKLASIVLAVGCVSVLRTVPAALAALVGACLLAAAARLPWRWLLSRLSAVATFLLPFAGLLPFLVHDGEPTWQLGPLEISGHGLSLALVLSAKALAMVTLVMVLLASAPLELTMKAAHHLHVPGLLVQLGMLTYRYLFMLAGELSTLRVALRVRGYRNRATRHSYRTIGHVSGTLLVRSYERSERVGQAMTCRGFDGRFRSLSELHTRPADVLAFVLMADCAAGLLAWDLWLRT